MKVQSAANKILEILWNTESKYYRFQGEPVKIARVLYFAESGGVVVENDLGATMTLPLTQIIIEEGDSQILTSNHLTQKEDIKIGSKLMCKKAVHWKQYGIIIKQGEIVEVHSFSQNDTHKGIRVKKGSSLFFIPFIENWGLGWTLIEKKQENR